MREGDLLIDSLKRKLVIPPVMHDEQEKTENECPQGGILRDGNAGGKNLARKQQAGHFQEAAGF